MEGEVDQDRKRAKTEGLANDFLDFLPNGFDDQEDDAPVSVARKACKQFWKAGDYDGSGVEPTAPATMDHVRVHPKFLHTNATSHKWALGAIAELLDNALDEVSKGATFVNVGLLKNPVDGSPMLLVEDNGGGMTNDRMRQCMSFGYSAKDKQTNTIGQYGNGFKTSTMRLGADVIVFSKSQAKKSSRPQRSVGMLSYTYLRETRQQDIIVPTLDYEEDEKGLHEIQRGTRQELKYRIDAITKWSPYQTEESIRSQFKKIKGQGTRIIVYNLWEDGDGRLELDLETDPHDIQIRGGREEAKSGLEKYPSAKYYMSYHYSLRTYAAILYLRMPKNFKITLRGKEVEHHSIMMDAMHIEEHIYKPQHGQEGHAGMSLTASVQLGFLKDAREHIDVQGFNVYHKNRLIKPYWRIWNSPSSQGRGVIGVLEANFVEPAHDKQGFERTTVLQRLESRLLMMQKKFWNANCQKVGYQGVPPNKKRKAVHEEETATRPQGGRRVFLERAVKARRSSSSSSDVSNDNEEDQPIKEAFPRKQKNARKAAKEICEEVCEASDVLKAKDTLKAKEFHVPLSEVPATPKESTAKAKEIPAKWKEISVQPPKSRVSKENDGDVPRDAIVVSERREQTEELSTQELNELEHERNVLMTRMDEMEATGDAKLEIEVARKKELEEYVIRLQEELISVQHGLLEERDRYKQALEEERKERELDDREIRKQLKSVNQRVRELEAEKVDFESERISYEAKIKTLENMLSDERKMLQILRVDNKTLRERLADPV